MLSIWCDRCKAEIPKKTGVHWWTYLWNSDQRDAQGLPQHLYHACCAEHVREGCTALEETWHAFRERYEKLLTCPEGWIPCS